MLTRLLLDVHAFIEAIDRQRADTASCCHIPQLNGAIVTPPGSEASIIFGTGVSSAVPGSVEGLHLIVYDIETTRADLIDRGVEVSEVFHDVGGIFHHAGTEGRVTGLDPKRRDYGSYASFSDPDGNGWLLQEVKTRAPGW